MNRSVSHGLAILTVLVTTGYAVAQPPAYNRWTGFNAIAPVQGNFNPGTPLTLTWGFMAPNMPINDSAHSGFANGNNNLQARLNVIYPGGQGVWQPLFQSVFDRWSAVSGLSYQFEANDDGAAINTGVFPGGVLGTRADLRIGGKTIDGNSGVLAYNYFPNTGEMVIDTNDSFFNNTANNSISLRNVVSHEHGHGMGMPHVESSTQAFLMEPFVNTSFDGPQYHDVLAAHHMYGDFREKSNAGLGNDTFARATPLGTLQLHQTASIGNSARMAVVAPTATDFVSIDNSSVTNSDIDFYSFTVNSAGPVSILLEALGLTYTLTPQGGGGNVAFNTAQRSDLTLTLIGPDGTTVLQTINAGGLGFNETLLFNLPASGTYFIRITGDDNSDGILLDTQFYGLTVTPVPEPGSVFLFASVFGASVWAGRRAKARRGTHLARS